ncbi:MAG: hypothetical protein P1P85_01130 [Patescibacteria group bacterium]|nr:hypothetical protein [Patescibacteria group bacterium]
MDIRKFLKKQHKSDFPKRTKEELRIIADLSNKKLLRRLSDAEKVELNKLCYERDPVFPKKNIKEIKVKFGKASAEIDD